MELDFGTAGIRAIVGPNKENLNEIHAARIFDGYAKYLIENVENAKERGIIIGRDNRIKGKIFTWIAVKILNEYGIKTYFHDQMIPTPFISYLTKVKKAAGAINITASHNPKEYNGIKIYNEHGIQMLPNEVMVLKTFFLPYESYLKYSNFNEQIDLNSNLIIPILDNDYDNYINGIKTINYDDENFSNLKIVYSSLHGTGYPFIKKLFKNTKIQIFYEQNEIMEDENFSYVENPNPEYQSSFNNSIKLANKVGANLIFVTDPDSDRVGIAIRNQNNEFTLLTGNEIAILICDYLLNFKPINKTKKYYLIYSFVSTSLPAKMCNKKGIDSYIIETGFKWIGSKINELKSNEKFFFGFEESYGSLINDKLSYDKDAIQSLFALIIIASKSLKDGDSLINKLDKIYQEYGYVKAKSFSFDLNSIEQLQKIKKNFENLSFENATYFDYTKGIRNIEPCDMLSYEFDDNISWISLRPSGTEPKYKLYLHIVDKSLELAEKKFKAIYQKLINCIKD